jgi:phosphopantothenoylcysteine decarboxylase/phosphopantothenate--cysteine ligase
MDEDMWKHPSTKTNLGRISTFGNDIISVSTGELASGLYGEGRMAEPEEILGYIEKNYFSAGELAGKKALVSAGPTYEPIDPVRFVGNHSTGKMGVAIARELQERSGCYSGTGSGRFFDLSGFTVERVQTAKEMYEACMESFPGSDITVMAAAVADYTPEQVAGEKIKKSDDQWTLSFSRTTDILRSLGEQKKNGQVLVGFALETNNEEVNALEKLTYKNADIIVLNSLRDEGAGFGHDTNKISVFDKRRRKSSI